MFNDNSAIRVNQYIREMQEERLKYIYEKEIVSMRLQRIEKFIEQLGYEFKIEPQKEMWVKKEICKH